MMPRCDIEKLQKDIQTLKEYLGGSYQLIIERNIIIEKQKQDLIILAHKLLSVKPELEEWVKLNFGEYL